MAKETNRNEMWNACKYHHMSSISSKDASDGDDKWKVDASTSERCEKLHHISVLPCDEFEFLKILALWLSRSVGTVTRFGEAM